jgi:hypothetical protein
MTLIEYLALCRDITTAIRNVKEAIASAESPEELQVLALRLDKACDVLSSASCNDTSTPDIREAKRLVSEGRRLALALLESGSGQEARRKPKSDGRGEVGKSQGGSPIKNNSANLPSITR